MQGLHRGPGRKGDRNYAQPAPGNQDVNEPQTLQDQRATHHHFRNCFHSKHGREYTGTRYGLCVLG